MTMLINCFDVRIRDKVWIFLEHDYYIGRIVDHVHLAALFLPIIY